MTCKNSTLSFWSCFRMPNLSHFSLCLSQTNKTAEFDLLVSVLSATMLIFGGKG